MKVNLSATNFNRKRRAKFYWKEGKICDDTAMVYIVTYSNSQPLRKVKLSYDAIVTDFKDI